RRRDDHRVRHSVRCGATIADHSSTDGRKRCGWHAQLCLRAHHACAPWRLLRDLLGERHTSVPGRIGSSFRRDCWRSPAPPARRRDGGGDGVSTSNVRGVRLMVRVGRMHYEQGLRQMEIAEKLEISTAKVSRLLKRAEAEGIVRTMVMTPQGMHPELEEFLEEEYGLEEVIVADARGSAREVLPALSAVGAEYVHRSLQTPGTAGVSAWSETLDGVALNLRVDAGARAGTVVQLIGGSGPASAQLASMQMLERFAKALSAEPVMVPFAGVVSTAEARRVILEDSSLADVVEQWDSVDIAFLGIGGLQASPTLRRSGNISTSVQEELRKLGSVGDI